MINYAKFGRMAAASLVIAGLGFASVASAADVSKDQLKAAHEAIQAIGTTKPFDNILPDVAEQLKANLIQASPNYQDLISKTVDAKALDLAPRRRDLENEAAEIYAKSFSVEELKAISTFFGSDAGKKFLKDMPLVNRELYKAANIWGAGIQRDLSKSAGDDLEKVIGAKVKAGEAPAPLSPDAVMPKDTSK